LGGDQLSSAAESGGASHGVFGELCIEAYEFAAGCSVEIGPEPRPESVAYKEIHSSSIAGSNGNWKGETVLSAYSIANAIFISAAGEYLLTLGTLLKAESVSSFGFQVVTRSLVECAARAWWILDPHIGPRERVIRCRSERFDSIIEHDKLTSAGNSRETSVSDTQIRFRAETAKLGIEEVKNGKGRFKNFENVLRPTNTEAVSAFLRSRGEIGAETWYRFYSGIAHSAIYATISSFDRNLDEATGYFKFEPRVTVAEVFDAGRTGADSFLAVFARYAFLFGYDQAPILSKIENIKEQFLDAAMKFGH
jgi:hypothetical protein